MNDHFEEMSEAIGRALEVTETTRNERLREFAELDPLPVSPRATWALLGLVLHEERQKWVAGIAKTKLADQLESMSICDAHVEETGVVPGLTEWEYHVGKSEVGLKNRMSGETIYEDLAEGTGELIHSCHYSSWLASQKNPSFVEKRLHALNPCSEILGLSFYELLEYGFVDLNRRGRIRLTPPARQWRDQIMQLSERCNSQDRRIQAAAALGDWLLLRECVGDIDWVIRRVEEHRNDQTDRLLDLLEYPDTRLNAMHALMEINAPVGRAIIRSELRASGDDMIDAVLLATSCRHGDWTKEISEAFSRIDPTAEDPGTEIWMMCADYLVRRGCSKNEVGDGLRCLEDELGEAAVLAREFFPELAVDLFKKALRSKWRRDRRIASAAMVILDEPWCHAELQDALNEAVADFDCYIHECRAALHALPHPELHEFVADWERRNLSEPNGAESSTAKRELDTSDRYLQWDILQLRDRVLPLRNQEVAVTIES